MNHDGLRKTAPERGSLWEYDSAAVNESYGDFECFGAEMVVPLVQVVAKLRVNHTPSSLVGLVRKCKSFIATHPAVLRIIQHLVGVIDLSQV